MSKAKNYGRTKNNLQSTTVKILFQCPICAQSASLDLNREIFEPSDNLTTISVPKGLICDHCFQAFIDKNYTIRGYQKVDFELNQKEPLGGFKDSKEEKTELSKEEEQKEPQEVDFTQILLTQNKLIYDPEKPQKNNTKRRASLKSIYEDFWEFIPHDNKQFRKFIKNDKRRIHYIF